MQYDSCTYDKNAFISETAQAGVKNLNSFSLFSLPRSCCLASIKLIQCCYIANLVNNSSMPITQLWLEASHPRMLLIYAYCKGRSCKTLFLQWREYFVGTTSSEVAAVLRKWRTEGQRTIPRAGMIIDLSSTRSPPQPNPTQVLRAGVRVLSYSNWLIIFLPTNEKPSSFSLSTNDKPPYIQ